MKTKFNTERNYQKNRKYRILLKLKKEVTKIERMKVCILLQLLHFYFVCLENLVQKKALKIQGFFYC